MDDDDDDNCISAQSKHLCLRIQIFETDRKWQGSENVFTYANLTLALESPSLIGLLMRAHTSDWPSGLAIWISHLDWQVWW